VGAIDGMPGLGLVRISVEEDAVAAVRNVLDDGPACRIDFVPAADNLADSVHGALEGLDGPVVVTTADHVLLKSSSVATIVDALQAGDADAVVAFAQRAAVLAAHPDGQRRFYRFADDSYSNCNLYGLAGSRGRAAVEIFRSGGQFAKNPWRIAVAFGLFNLLLVRFALVSLPRALARISRRIGVRIVPLVLADGSQAIDVDNERTCRIAEQLLDERSAAQGTRQCELAA
jgi:hypothetical protein